MTKIILDEKLQKIFHYKDYPMKDFAYLRIGGKADYLFFPKDYDEVITIYNFSKENNIPFTIVGNCSNLIIRDGGIRGFVVSLKKLNKINVNDNELTTQAGAQLIWASFIALKHSLSGLEFACGIPGTIGGAVAMNAGAYDGEIKDVFKSCEVLTNEGKIVTKTKEELDYSYRSSSILKNKEIVLSATFSLQKGNYQEIKDKMLELTKKRLEKQPLEYPSCGSVFKRPKGYYVGKLIQDAKLQGLRIGDAMVSTKHAGFIINTNKATAKDYISLINLIRKKIYDEFNILLEQEVLIIGEE